MMTKKFQRGCAKPTTVRRKPKIDIQKAAEAARNRVLQLIADAGPDMRHLAQGRVRDWASI